MRTHPITKICRSIDCAVKLRLHPPKFYGSVIQQIEVLSSKQKAVGAIPTGVAKFPVLGLTRYPVR